MKTKKQIKLPKDRTFILYKSKWICGTPDENDNPNNYMGEGDTMLLNNEGYYCCLGMFCEQMGVKLEEDEDEGGYYEPRNLDMRIPALTSSDGIRNSKLSNKAIEINDNEATTVEQKIKQLKSLFSKWKYKIIVKD